MIKIKKKQRENKKKSLKIRIKERLFHKNQKADIVSADTKNDTINLRVKETLEDSQGNVIQKRERTRRYSLSTKHGLTPKREGEKSKRIRGNKKTKPKIKLSNRTITLKNRDLEKGEIWLRWENEGNEIKVKTNHGIKKAKWMGDKYLLTV